MKKRIILGLVVLLSAGLAGCGKGASSGRNAGQAPGVEDVLEAGMAAEDAKETQAQPQGGQPDLSQPETEPSNGGALSVQGAESTDAQDGRQSGVDEGAPEPESVASSAQALSSTDGIDVDLTTLSSTMVYSEVFAMMSTPESYIGKSVKMDGLFAYYYDEAADQYYFACIVQDATACCSQGIEFVLAGDYSYPEDYPEPGAEIAVSGVFDTYEEGGMTYCTLRNAAFV